MRRLTRASVSVLALLAIGLATANPYSLACDLALPTTRGGCFLERTDFRLGPLEGGVGLDVRWDGDAAHVAPYTTWAWYGDPLTLWLELKAPRLGPVFGSPDVLRVGFRLSF